MNINLTKMTQKTIKSFINEVYSRAPKNNYATNKTDVYHNDDFSSSDILDLNDYGPENKRRYRYVLVVIDNFSKLGWTVTLENKSSQTITNSFENFLIASKRKPSSIETDDGSEFVNKLINY